MVTQHRIFVLLMLFVAVSIFAAPPNPQAGEVARAIELCQPSVDAALLAIAPAATGAFPAFVHPGASDATVRKVFQTFQSRYYHLCELMLRHIPVQDEIRRANTYFEGFFATADNDPELVKRVQGLADTLSWQTPKKCAIHSRFAALSPAWKEEGENKRFFRVGVLSGPGMTIIAKGGDMIVVSKEIAELPDDELAGLLAHEMLHLLNRDFLRASIVRQVNQRWVARFAQEKREQFKNMAEYCFWNWQRSLEFETDLQALELLKKARFNPDGLARALKRMSAGNSRDTTPSPDERRNALIRVTTRFQPAHP
jgi:Zn-dependent protease with chaperone function